VLARDDEDVVGRAEREIVRAPRRERVATDALVAAAEMRRAER